MSNSIYSLYKTTNLINGKIYIGVHKETEWPNIDDYLGSGFLIIKAIKKHGNENFKRKILCISNNSEYIYYLESQYVTATFINEQNNYNACGGGYGASTHSETTKLKISESHKGKTHSDETKRKVSEARKGKTHSDETKLKIGTKHKGKIVSDETRKKMSAARKGKNGNQHTVETRKKMSDAKKDYWAKKRGEI